MNNKTKHNPIKMKNLLLLSFILFASCKKEADSPIGNTLFNWKLSKYKGPDSNWKWLKADSVDALKDDGMRFTASQIIVPNPYGGSMWGNKYTGTIYQGTNKYWPSKPDFSFETTYINDSTFKLGNDRDGYNLAFYNGWGETLTIKEISPVEGRQYEYEKTSD